MAGKLGKIDMLNLVGGIIITLMGISYLFTDEFVKGLFEMLIGLFLLTPFVYRKLKGKI
jgi:hypothetical protein